MPRKPRVFKDEGYYHVISRGNNQEPVFLSDNDFRVFKQAVLEAKLKYPFKLFHYCLMPNHVHLLLQVSKGRELSKIMHLILLIYSRWFKKQTGHTGHLWQGRFRSPLIDKESYMLECGRYVERNPVIAGIVKTPEDYVWSSHPHYAHGTADPLVDDDPYFESFGINLIERRKNYRKFVALQGPYDSLLDQVLIENHI